MDTNDIPSVAKHIMEQKLIITGFIERLTTKTATLERYVKKIQNITMRIDFHKITMLATLLENEWQELGITWTALDVRRTSPDDMHGLHSIITRTETRVVDTLRMSYNLLRTAQEGDAGLAKGGPPGGIPTTPNTAMKGPTVVKKRLNAEITTRNDERTRGGGTRGDKTGHEITRPNRTEKTNSNGERMSRKQAEPRGGDTVVGDVQNNINPKAEHPGRARKGTDAREREVATPAHKTRVAEDGDNRRNKTVDINKEQRQRGAVSRADQKDAGGGELKIQQDTSQGCGQTGENKTIEVTGPQAWRAVVALCHAYKRQVNMWILEEEQIIHRTSTEKHLHANGQTKKWLCEQLSGCQIRMHDVWREHKRVLSIGGDDRIRHEYDNWNEEIELMKQELGEAEEARADAEARQTGKNTLQPDQRAPQARWDDEVDQDVMRVKLCSEEDASPMSTKVRMSAKTEEPQEVELDKDQVLAWAEEAARIRMEDVLARAREESWKRGTNVAEEINNNKDIHARAGTEHLNWLSPDLRPYPEQPINKNPIHEAEGPITRITETAVQITQQGDVLRLPNGMATVFIVQSNGGAADATPIRVDAPETGAGQYWCTIRVNMPGARAKCPESGLALDTGTLKTLVQLSATFQTTTRILIHREGESETLGAYAHPDLRTHVLVGPFNVDKPQQPTPQQKPIEDAPPTPLNRYPPNWLGTIGDFIKEPIVYIDQTGKYAYITPKRHAPAQETVVEVDVPQSFEKWHDRATQNTEERTHADGGHDVLRLPDGVSVVNMTQTKHNRPMKIILPMTERNQYWYTINVDTPNSEVTCIGSGLVMKVKVLRDTVELANQNKTTIRIPITANQGIEDCGVYAIPGLETHVFIGPFTSKDGEGTQTRQKTGTKRKQYKPWERRRGLPRTDVETNIPTKNENDPINSVGGEKPSQYKELTEHESESNYVVDNIQPNATCARITVVDDKQKSIQGKGDSARTRLYEFKERNPTRSANELPERFWETHPRR